MYTYSLSGTVDSMTGTILPSDSQPYVVFGFRSKRDGGPQFYNGVFYIRLEGEPAETVAMLRAVVIGFTNQVPIVITWTADIPWDHVHDPGGVICDAKLKQ